MTLVSENIRYLRKLNGLTQEQFSRKINIKRSLLGAYEEGRANPNQQNIQAIAKAFNTTIELLTRQDLRKLRETPNLSIPLGQPAKAPDVRIRHEHADGPTIRSDGKIVMDDDDQDDPFQHPDFPDIFAQPKAPQPEPQPLASVLNKYYRTQDEMQEAPPSAPRSVPVPPVIRSPERPGNTAFQAVQSNSPVDRLFGQQPERENRASPAVSRPADNRPAGPRGVAPMTFNNVYEGRSEVAHTNTPAQSMAPAIPVVMETQFGEYSQRHQQAEFLHRLPAMQLPLLPHGHYRAFEAGDDFSFPGALLIGQFVRNWFDIADGKLYVLLLHNTGICCRRIYNQVKIKGTLLLTADRADIPNREVSLKDVLEVWEVSAFVSQQLPPPAPNTDRLRQLVDELRFEVERI
ncbi:helix-turn-helix domain-containing protein [Spirosoma utsteinense]|uniref:Transcriptional regulator with XRE-family HTH domain n=1 Tax=Spirosoma utsteinense TaxID=2585773 RepID=A0ABR6VZ97_9BACT|nr:helix-turn-helix domain-containing protein [Spirosoma utsteinense]MBC3784601.1 transcriptional regulator with XRE-family HTH domain [Spirosoma utsteinense]MBC3789646.1 transcriptional regulator with XRE-family HTH domain [Spirosoma utsteinense]